MNPNINNICSFLTSIAEGHLYQSFYHQRMGLLRLGLVSECRVTKNTTNDTNFSHIFFNIFNVIVDYFKTTLTSADTKQKKWLLIPKVASTIFLYKIMIWNSNWDMWGSTLTPQHLTESPRTEQQSLWTCCQQLEAPWDFSLDSPSSVQ